MGSNSSSNAPPQETQSAPVTARSTPNQPKRNRNFQEVQIGQAGTTPRSKQPERNRGPSPKPHQSTSTRGQDPGASGGGSDKKTAQQTPRQGAAANGGKQSRSQQKQNTMPSQQSQQKQNMMPSQQQEKYASIQELLDAMQTSVRANKEVSGIHDNKGSGAVNDDPNDPMVNDLADPDKKKNVGGFHGNGTAKRNEIFGGKVNKNAIKNNANPSSTSGQKGKSAEESKKSLEKSSENKTTSNSIVSKKDEEKKKTVEALDVGGKQGDKLKAGKHLSVKFKEETIEIPETPTTIKQNDKQKREENELKKTSALNSEESKSKNDLSDKQDKSIADKKLLMDSVKKKMLNTRGVNGDIVVNTYQSHHEFDTDNISYDHGSEIDDETHDYHGEMDGVTSNQTDFYDDESHGDMSIDETGPAETINDHSGEVLQMKDDDLVFETFYHRSGKEFQCIYQSGMRFYLDDWGSKEWQPFPKRWYNEGLLVTNTILKDDSNNDQARNDQSGGTSSQGQSTSRSQGRSSGGGGRSGGGGGGGSGDDREGFLMHPSRGRVPTYIFYKKHNVHMYFDKDTGSWVRLPIGWELHHNMVKSLVDQVEEALPSWNDRHDILSLLRACNYDPDECISIYLHLEKDEWFKAPRTAKEGKALKEKENQVTELEKKVRDLEIQLEKERTRREEAERNVEEQTTMMSEMEAESKQTEAQLSAVTGGRPKSARPVSRMVKAGKGPPTRKGVTPMPVHKGENVNPEDIQDLNANAMELRKSHTRMKMEVERYMGDFKHILEKVGPAFKQLKSSEKGTQNEIEEVRALYRKEALQRKLLYNQLQELRGNIRVFCRVRKDDRGECCIKFPSDQDMIAIHPQQGKKMFSFDKVFGMGSTQEQVFEDTKPIITSCADGYNVCLLAYGQTGSGKTFTMMGPESNPGINIRAMKELFNVCDERKETMKYNLTVSLVEIYNETIQDLLTNDAKTLELRTAGNKVNIPGLIEYPIKNVDDVKKVMAMGDKNRSVASTKMNSTSSRSHLVLMLTVEGHDKVTSAITRGTLVLCDLAGSERIGKTEAEGQRLVEAAAINKSLSALGQVFSALRSSQLHVPYRNSKLTQILQPSLGGDAKACLFVNVSPDLYNFAETVSTLSFGNNARQVALGQAKQNISKGNR